MISLKFEHEIRQLARRTAEIFVDDAENFERNYDCFPSAAELFVVIADPDYRHLAEDDPDLAAFHEYLVEDMPGDEYELYLSFVNALFYAEAVKLAGERGVLDAEQLRKLRCPDA